jgi:hypothetical protein
VQISVFVKLKLTKCARAGDRAGLFRVRNPRTALDAQSGENQMTFKAKDFEQRLHRLESVPRRDRGKPDDASWDRPAAGPPLVLFSCN